jgi:hypothetical protein
VWTRKVNDLLAAFVIGNGVLDLIAPRERYSMWVFGPEGLRKVILWFADHPTALRLRGIARIGVGLWLALSKLSSWSTNPSKSRRGGGGLSSMPTRQSIV